MRPLSLTDDPPPTSFSTLTNRAIFSSFVVPPELLHLSRCIRWPGEVTRYFTLFFELDSFPLAIITTSFGPCPGTDGDGEEGANQAVRVSLFIQASALPSSRYWRRLALFSTHVVRVNFHFYYKVNCIPSPHPSTLTARPSFRSLRPLVTATTIIANISTNQTYVCRLRLILSLWTYLKQREIKFR